MEKKYQDFLHQGNQDLESRSKTLKPGSIHEIHLARDARAPAAVPQVTTTRMWFFFFLGS